MSERWQGGALKARADALRADDYERGRAPEDIDRRSFLVAGMNATSLALASGMVVKFARGRRAGAEVRKRAPASEPERVSFVKDETHDPLESWRSRPLSVPPALVGKRVPDMEWGYYAPMVEDGATPVPQTSLPDMLPPVAFHDNLAELFTKKSELIGSASDKDEQLQLYHRLSREYRALFEKNETRRMNLPQFRSLIEQESHTMLEALAPAYPKMVETYLRPHMKKEDMGAKQKEHEMALAKVLEYLARHITPDMMLAYIATELFPVPARSMDALEFILENAGVEFIERIPALGDTLESIGIFQLTKMVSGPRGSVNNLMGVIHRKDVVPHELKDFSSIEDHIRAGYLFAFHNVITLLQDLVEEGKYDELTTLLESASTGSNNGTSTVFLEYLAGAHHRPTVAREIASNWLTQHKDTPQATRPRTIAGAYGDSRAEKEVGAYMDKSRQSFLHLLHRRRTT